MHNRFPRLAWASFEDQVVLRPQRTKALFEYYFDNLSMIPEEKQFLVIDESTDSSIGVLDEAFMAEYGKPGHQIHHPRQPMANHPCYRRKSLRSTCRRSHRLNTQLDWRGNPCSIRNSAGTSGNKQVSWRRKPKAVLQANKSAHCFLNVTPPTKKPFCMRLEETLEQVHSGFPVPTPKRIVVEDWTEFIIVHSNFGSLTKSSVCPAFGASVVRQTWTRHSGSA